MDRGWLTRVRWRRRGAWLWPVFATLTVVDGLVGHLLPPSGDSMSIAAAAVAGLVANLIAVVLLARPLGALLRRVRRDLPGVVARNDAGALVVVAVSGVLLGAGIAHRSTLVADRHAMADAIVRAQAWIGDRAPVAFRRNVARVDTFAIQPGSIYRTCVPSADGRRNYCVVVNTQLPFSRSVSFAGYEPNAVLAEGAG